MAFFSEQFRIATDSEKKEAVARLVKASTGDFDFYMFAILGVSMASIGLVLNSPEVVIGSMLIAPVLYPLLSLSLSLVLFDAPLMYRSVRTLIISFCVSIFISFFVTFFIAFTPYHLALTDQVLMRAEPSVLAFFVAFISGFAATYAMVHANLNELLPGVAISVSLVPPLAVVGMGLATLNWATAGGALLLFTLNVIGIMLASLIAFSLMDLHRTRKVAESAIKQEERRLKDEAKKMEEIKKEDIHT